MTKRADSRKYHYIYKTTCSVNNKFYYGLHSTDNLDDGYIGSGTKLWHSIRKYGRENFSLEILEFLDSREAIRLREKELVNEELLKDPMCMNLALGGGCGFEILNRDKKNIYGKNGQIGFGGENLSKNKSKAAKTSWQRHRPKMLECALKAIKAATINAALPEAIKKRKETYIKTQHQQGVKNSSYGTKWIINPSTLEITKIKSNESVPDGWSLGRVIKVPKPPRKKKDNSKKISVFRDYHKIYCEHGFEKFKTLTNYKFSKANLVQAFSKYLDEFVPQNGKTR